MIYENPNSRIVEESKPVVFDLSFRTLFRANLFIYRKLCDKILDIGINILNRSPLVKESFQSQEDFAERFRENKEVDFVFVTAKKETNAFLKLIGSDPLYDSEELVHVEKEKRESEKNTFREKISNQEVHTFCFHTAELIYALIPKYINNKLIELAPMQVENSIKYQFMFLSRYFINKVEYKLELREKFLQSTIGDLAKQALSYCSNHLTEHCLSRYKIEPLVDFEHFLLKVSAKISSSENTPSKKPPLKDILLRSFAESIQLLEKCDEYLKKEYPSEKYSLDSTEELILRLDWYKENNALPKGFPNPRDPQKNKEGIDVNNIEEKLDEALYQYLNRIGKNLINKSINKKEKGILWHSMYWLEGEDALINILSYLVAELGIKQISNTHNFTLAILQALNEETTDFEIGGFGRGNQEKVLKTAVEIINHSLTDSYTASTARSIFNNTDLKANCKGKEGIDQKLEAKEKLKTYIHNFLYKKIKEGEKYKHQGSLKEVREFMQGLPVVGAATTTFHLIFNGMYFSLGYFFQDEQKSLLSHLTHELGGKKLANYLTEKIMNLIYHPCWKFALLHILEEVDNHFQKNIVYQERTSAKEHMHTIRTFIVNHFCGEYKESAGMIINYLLSEESLEVFMNASESNDRPLIEPILSSLTTTVKEQILCWRLLESYKLDGISFPGDEKFWEVALLKLLTNISKTKWLESHAKSEKIDYHVLANSREEIVNHLLSLNSQELREKFIQLYEESENPPLPKVIKKIDNNNNIHIIEDYKTLSSDDSDEDWA